MMIFNHSDHVHSHIGFLHENSNETFLWIFNHSGMSTQAVIFAFGKKIQMTFFEDFQLLWHAKLKTMLCIYDFESV